MTDAEAFLDEPTRAARLQGWLAALIGAVTYVAPLVPVVQGGSRGMNSYDGAVYWAPAACQAATAGLAHGLVPYRYSSSCTRRASASRSYRFAALGRVIGDQAKRRVSGRRWPIPHATQLWSQPA
jgi:hypothetical protein